jgi:hypothetical protein
MNIRIWKWPLEITDRQVISMPAGSRLLAVQMQSGFPQIWALCDADAPRVEKEIAIYGTGNPIPGDPGAYIGTFQTNGGTLVWHAFVWHAFEVAA